MSFWDEVKDVLRGGLPELLDGGSAQSSPTYVPVTYPATPTQQWGSLPYSPAYTERYPPQDISTRDAQVTQVGPDTQDYLLWGGLGLLAALAIGYAVGK